MSQDQFTDFLRCKLCSNFLKSPLILPCTHSFCQSCVQKLLSSFQFTCPFCGDDFPKFINVDSFHHDYAAEKMIKASSLKHKIEVSKVSCSKCDEETQATSFCSTCKKYLCKNHQLVHQSSKKTKSHQLVSTDNSFDFVSLSNPMCSLHDRQYDSFCKSCFQLCCPHCLFSTHKSPDHITCPFFQINTEEEIESLHYLFSESNIIIEMLKSSIQEVDQMLEKAKQRSAALFQSLKENFFDLFEKILSEVQTSLLDILQKNERVLLDQKMRAETQLKLLEKEIQSGQKSIQMKNVQGILLSKVEIYNVLSTIPLFFSVPQRTDNIQLSCADYSFSPNGKMNLADQQKLVFSIVNLFNQLFGIKLTIPSLQKIETALKQKPEAFEQQKEIREDDLKWKLLKIDEEKKLGEKSKIVQEKKEQILADIRLKFQIQSPRQIQTNWRSLIENWIGECNWNLLYKASRDGFQSFDFHSKCDNQGPTVTFVISKSGYVFGGYTPLSWSSAPGFLQDHSNRTFIFTLTNPHDIPSTKYYMNNPQCAIYCHPSHGPSFGSGCDIFISQQCDKENSCSTNFPDGYVDSTGRGKTTFTGSCYFSVQEIEVYRISS